jgi:hypothetical protein
MKFEYTYKYYILEIFIDLNFFRHKRFRKHKVITKDKIKG